jgi:HD-GYP domain-containing protein (c-di-GMP phosphodiesterase class II)
MVQPSHSPADERVAGVCPCRAEVLAALARVLDWPLGDQVPHHARVAAIAARLAAHLGGYDVRGVFYAALVHDIGLAIGGSDTARGPGLLDQANDPSVRCHPLIGAQVVGAVAGLFGAAHIILDHHEWANGHGYPLGKAADEIVPGAQVLRFADTCDLVLREQPWPELIPCVHAARGRTVGQVESPVADAGVEVLGEPGLYAQLRSSPDVRLLVAGAIRRHGAEDVASTTGEVGGLLALFGQAADAHASDKIGHSRRVANLASLVAMALGLAEADAAAARWAALVHDVGLVAAPRALLNKPGMLTEDELAQVRRHVTMPETLFGPIRGLEEVGRIAAAHGEAFDGSGHPRGLAGRDIPIGSRILAVCDAFDALTSRRPHRDARPADLAIDILYKASGSLFDPDVADAAAPVLLASAEGREPAPAQA